MVGTLIGTIGACSIGNTPITTLPTHKVVYSITGDGKADITYTLGTSIAQNNGALLPWTHRVDKSTSTGHVLSAQSKSTAGITISCSVTVDDQVTVTNVSSGAYASVSCASEK